MQSLPLPHSKARRVPLEPHDAQILGICGQWLELDLGAKFPQNPRQKLDSNIENLEFTIKGQRFNLRLIKYAIDG